MNKPFVPQQPEKMMLVKISGREASLIKILRKYAFGEFVIHKRFDRLNRIEIRDSKMLKEKGALDLAVEEL